MKTFPSVVSLIALGFLASPCAVLAATQVNNFDLGTLTNSSSGISDQFSTPGDSFVDNWYFTISPDETSAAVAGDIDNLPAFDIGSFGAKLIGPSQTWDAVQVGDTFRIDPMLLPAGIYDFQVFGTVIGTVGAAYGGTISAFTSPVPEPETYGMLMAGVSCVGLMVRRRKAKSVA